MKWYNIYKLENEYVVIKNVKLNNSVGSTRKFAGTKNDCIKFCETAGIKLGYQYRKTV